MPNYNFKKDLPIARETEKEVSDKLKEFYNWKTIAVREDNKYDLLVERCDGRIIKVEVKEDFTCRKTGNVGLEFECRGKASGIAVTQATHYVYKIHRPDEIIFRVSTTKLLRKAIANEAYWKIVVGGDEGSNSKNYLFYYLDFCDYSEEIFKDK